MVRTVDGPSWMLLFGCAGWLALLLAFGGRGMVGEAVCDVDGAAAAPVCAVDT
jgi:hypothetical protein